MPSLEWSDAIKTPWILEAVKALGYEKMTPVQASAIPLFSGNKDVVVEAVTGLGKTAAFVIPMLQRYMDRCAEFRRGHIFGVIVAPTRELAIQINSVFESFIEACPVEIRTQRIIGSLGSFQEDLQALQDEKPQFLIGTPGKMCEFLDKIKPKLGDFDCLVLDEADKLLDVSFESTVRDIVSKLPRQKRVGLFSATISSAGSMIFKIGMLNPVKVVVSGGSAAPSSLSINYTVVEASNKIKKLLLLLNRELFARSIVYLPTCVGVTHFYSMLNPLVKGKLKLFLIHGKLPLKARMRTLDAFAQSNEKAVLFATDVAARGIDIPDVDLVLQLDPPTDPDVFLHRCGRTGRAHKVGKAIVMLNAGREESYVDFMQVRKVNMGEEDDDETEDLDVALGIEYGLTRRLEDIVRKWVLEDRSRFDLGVRSYVGYIRYYSKHTALSIFRLSELDYVGTARMYGLIRLPRMPEMRYIADDVLEKYPDGWLGPKIDMDAYSYKSSQREKARLEELANTEKKEKEKQLRKEKRKLNEAWSNKTNAKEARATRKEKMKRKREAIEKELESGSSDEEVQKDWKEEVKKRKNEASIAKFEGL